MPKFFSFLNGYGRQVVINLAHVDVVYQTQNGNYELCLSGPEDQRYEITRADFNRFCKLTGV